MSSAFRTTLASVVVVAALLPVTASAAQAERKDGYLTDSQGGEIRAQGAGVCVRTSQWTPALATMACDPDLVPKPAPKPAAAKPKPKPEAKPEAKPAAKPAAKRAKAAPVWRAAWQTLLDRPDLAAQWDRCPPEAVRP